MQQSLVKFDKSSEENYLAQKIIKEYGYDAKDIETNFILGNTFIDIAVFTDSTPHINSNCWIASIISSDKEEAIGKLKILFSNFPNLEFGIWSDGNDFFFLRRNQKLISEVFNIPKKGKSLELPKRTELKEPFELSKTFSIIHNHIYANDGLSSQEAFNEVLKLLFIKIQDEKNKDGEYVKFGISEEEYSQVMSGKESTFNKRVQKLFDDTKNNFKDVFSQNESINLKKSTLAFVVGQLQNFNLSKSKRDVKGAAFQRFIYAHQRGSRGQFFTPDPIIELSIKILDPHSKEKVLDPACGTAGFLVETMKYVWKKEFSDIKDIERKTNLEKNYAIKNLRGIEINPTLSKVAKMRMILEDDGYTGIFTADSLGDIDILDKIAKENNNEYIKKGHFDFVLTNPPFGSQGRITNKSYLKKYDLGHKWIFNGKWIKTNEVLDGQVPDILFIERCLELLKTNGRMAIVLPTGDLENKSLEYIRQYLSEKAKILAVVSLPQKTFIPHGTGIKAVVLFLHKLDSEILNKEKQNDYKIFFSIIENVGYEGNKNGTPIHKKDEKGDYLTDTNGNLIPDEDVSLVCDLYSKFKNNIKFKEFEIGFIRRYSDLIERWDPEYYRPRFNELRTKLKKAGAVPLRSVVKIISQKSALLKNKDQDVRYVEIGNINPKTSELNSFSEMKVHELPSRASYEVKEGDIITAVSGISTGTPSHATAYVTSDFSGCIVTNGLRVLRSLNINPFYLLMYLKFDLFLEQMLQCRTGAAIPAVSDDELGDVLIPIPDKKIQEQIAIKVKESHELREKSKQVLENSKQVFYSII